MLLIGGVVVQQPWTEAAPPATPEVYGAPRLVVDQPVIDEGYNKLNVPVRTTFHLTNVGDQPLEILDEPQVKLIEGC